MSTSPLAVWQSLDVIGHWKAEAQGWGRFFFKSLCSSKRSTWSANRSKCSFEVPNFIGWVSEAHFHVKPAPFWVTKKGAGGWHVWWLKSKWSEILEFRKTPVAFFFTQKALKPVNKDKSVWRNAVYFCCWNGWVSDGEFAAKNWFGRGNRHAFLAVSLFECHASCLI